MKRREFISFAGGAFVSGAAVAWPLAVRAQEVGRVRKIGVLFAFFDTDPESQSRMTAFQQELENLGWRAGHNIQIEYRWANGDAERFRSFAAELVAARPDVLVGHASPGAEALARETRTIPIIFAVVSDPVGSGLAASLSEPGRNATGFTNFAPSTGAKLVEFLKALSPRLARVALLFNPATAPGRGSTYLQSVEAAAQFLGMDTTHAMVNDAAQIEDAIAALSGRSDSGLIVMPDVFMTNHRDLITDLAIRYMVPAIYPFSYFAEGGGLISYGIDLSDIFRRSAGYVDKVLRGAMPSSLPVQHPDKFELIINLRTARMLHLEVPRILLAGASKVIE
jgi:putative tryptophan/tyrosine transport system substrate-binding protein